jgi:ArsR family transcriptional regulator
MNLEKTRELEREFHACQKILTAIGDEVRQKLLLLMLMENREEIRVADLADKTSLTRPAVSHHIQILKDAGVIKSRKRGKCVYYYFDSTCQNVDALLRLLENVRSIIKMMKQSETTLEEE